MSDIVSAEAAAQEGEALLPSAELAKNLGLTLAASVVLTFSTIVYMQGGLHSSAPIHDPRSTIFQSSIFQSLRNMQLCQNGGVPAPSPPSPLAFPSP